MNLLEILMLILGVLIIIISCRIVGHPDKKESGLYLEGSGIKDIYMQEELNSFKEEQTEILTLASEEAIARTDDYLSKLSNEKIIAVSEYSDQILEKINRNHEEVVFLYNMLNNKEKELKKTVIEIESSQHNAKELIDIGSQENVAQVDTVKPEKFDTQAENIKKQAKEKSDLDPSDNNLSTISINNTEILKLYSQGKTVLDIAKQLGIGQGEVKLVIDLFSDR